MDRRRVLGPAEEDIELPDGTENTTAWGAWKRSVMDHIEVVFGRIDAPLGAERMHFGVRRDENR